MERDSIEGAERCQQKRKQCSQTEIKKKCMFIDASKPQRPFPFRVPRRQKKPPPLRIYTCILFDGRNSYWPGEMSMPCFCASWAHPPALASPPCFSANPLTRCSSSGLKCRTRPCSGQAKASPSARKQYQYLHRVCDVRVGKRESYRKWYVPPPAWSILAACQSPSLALARPRTSS